MHIVHPLVYPDLRDLLLPERTRRSEGGGAPLVIPVHNLDGLTVDLQIGGAFPTPRAAHRGPRRVGGGAKDELRRGVARHPLLSVFSARLRCGRAPGGALKRRGSAGCCCRTSSGHSRQPDVFQHLELHSPQLSCCWAGNGGRARSLAGQQGGRTFIRES